MNYNQPHSRPSPRNDLGLMPAIAAPALEIVIEQPQFRKLLPPPSLELPQQFISLIRDLSQEKGQLEMRRLHGLENPRKAKHKLARLKMIEPNQHPYRRLGLDHWEKLIVIAATVVDVHLGNDELADKTLVELHQGQLCHDTIFRDRKTVLEVIKLTDCLYLQWKDDLAFEVLILMDTPTSILRLQSIQKFEKLKRELQQCKPFTVTKDCLKFYIPFLVRLIRPNYSLSDIQMALGTSIFDERDWENFVRVSCGPDPTYDPARDMWVVQEPLPSYHQQGQESTSLKMPIPVDQIKGSVGGIVRIRKSNNMSRV
ncbi:Ff.00g063950.m01.CDS01 [Fusarium sp. VM40]|nr:Ff.00g063950.m01.CDS01 [Fusarium sp. VM40]